MDLFHQGYDKDGNALGGVVQIPKPERLRWNLQNEIHVNFYDFLAKCVWAQVIFHKIFISYKQQPIYLFLFN